MFSIGTRQSLIESTTFPSVSLIPSLELHVSLTQVLQLSLISHRLSLFSSCRSWVPEEVCEPKQPAGLLDVLT